jgi:hypothetical protein
MNPRHISAPLPPAGRLPSRLGSASGWKPSAPRLRADPRLYVSAQHSLYRNRKPSRLTLMVAGVTVTASVAVAAGMVTAGPGTPASQAAFLRAAAVPQRALRGTGQVTALTGRSLASLKSRWGSEEILLMARQAAERRADRRAARRAAARRAAARQAAARAAAQQPSQQTGSQQGGGAAAPPQPSGSPQQTAMAMLGSYGWPSSEFSCLDSLWNVESGWNVYATNPSSGAYGIPQALPGSKMASAGPDWQSDAATQIRWGLGYIQGTYGSPCAAWAHEQADGWY